MSELPTSGSEPSEQDVFESLWRLSVSVKNGRDARPELAAVASNALTRLENEVVVAVREHLTVAADLVSGSKIDSSVSSTLTRYWDAVLSELQTTTASLTPRSNAFHMRLASKYADYYRSFDQRGLEQWVRAAGLKSQFLVNVALYHEGATVEALASADNLARQWRDTLSPRLPGLYSIERAASLWAKECGDLELAASLKLRSEQGKDRSAPYVEDEPAQWQPPRTIEGAVRFAFAASTLPSVLMV